MNTFSMNHNCYVLIGQVYDIPTTPSHKINLDEGTLVYLYKAGKTNQRNMAVKSFYHKNDKGQF